MKKKFKAPEKTEQPDGTINPDTIRLQKFLSDNGVCSRRGAADLIESGRVTVNGAVPDGPGMRIDPVRAKVMVDGKPVKARSRKRFTYIAINKPRGYVTTMSDPDGRKTVLDLLRGVRERVVPVGRLDRDSEGLLLFTNDGEMIYRLTHPKYEVEKEYVVTVNGLPSEAELEELSRGVVIDGKRTLPAKAKMVEIRKGIGPEGGDVGVLSITLKEGRKRQVRRMCEAVGLEVRRLMRAREGKISLGDMRLGSWRYLKADEIKSLKKETGLDDREN